MFPDLNWKTSAWLVPHESLRWLMSLTKFITSHKNFDASDSKKAAALQVFFDDFYYPYIDSHHSAEDAVCGKHWPEVYGAGGMIGSQHVQVDALMKDMKAAVAE